MVDRRVGVPRYAYPIVIRQKRAAKLWMEL